MSADPPHTRRSFSTWVMLLAVWGTGLIVWIGYIALIVFVLARFFS